MSFEHLPTQQARDAQELYESLRPAFDSDLKAMVALMATKPDNKLFGETEFQIRDMVHQVGAKVIQTAAEQRKKRGM
jgi:hypothetical protein